MVTSVVKWAFPREFKGVVQKFPRAPPPDPAHASVRFYPGSAPETGTKKYKSNQILDLIIFKFSKRNTFLGHPGGTIKSKFLFFYRPLSPRTARSNISQEARAPRPPPERKISAVSDRPTKSAKTERRRIDVYVRPTASAGPRPQLRPQSTAPRELTTSRSNTMSTPGRKKPKPPVKPQKNRVREKISQDVIV